MSMTITDAEKVNERIQSGEIIQQKICDFIRELNSVSEERLNAVALTDGVREYTYRQMFRKWEEFAEAFSSVGMTGENRSRVGIYSVTTIETIFSIYALNMTGASISIPEFMSVFQWESLKKTIRQEKLTDLVILDNVLLPDLYQKLMQEKRRLGLKNVILLHADLNTPYCPERFLMISDLLSGMAQRDPHTVYLDELVEQDTAASLSTSGQTSEEAAVILHSTGTTSGIKKPIPYTNSAFNEGAARFLRNEKFCEMFQGSAVSLAASFLSGCYLMIDQLHLPLAFGGKVITIPLLDFLPERLFRAYDEFGVTIAFSVSFMFADEKAIPKVDLSCMKLLAIGGSYVSQDKKSRIDRILSEHGMKYDSTIGYGLSEAGGACFLTEPGVNNDTLGKPLPGIKVLLLDEDDGKFYRPEDGKRRGVLMIATPSLSSGRIDDTVYFEHTVIDGEPYLNTKDLVEAGEDGSLKIVGRANKFFTNDAGKRFDAGLVERAISAQPDVIDCGIAPEYIKALGDTAPALYVKIDGEDEAAEEILQKALENVFMGDDPIGETDLPYMCVIARNIPYTENGKVDVHKFNNFECDGTLYYVKSTVKDGKLSEILLERSPNRVDDISTKGWTDHFALLIDFLSGRDRKAPPHGNAFGRSHGSPFQPGSSRRRQTHGGVEDMMALMRLFEELSALSEEHDAPEPPRPGRRERPGCMRQQHASRRDGSRRMRPHPGRRPHRRNEPPMAELFRMMQAMHDQFEDAYEAQDDRGCDLIPPFFRMMQERPDERRRPPMPGKPGSGRRFFDPESGIPPFPCFMMDPQYDDADYDDYDEYEDHETDEDTRSNEQEDRRPPFGGPLSAMLRHMFHASDYDEFYED